MRLPTLALLTVCVAAVGETDQPAPRLGISASGHYVVYGGDTLMLIGDSGTQCVLQNANVDYAAWLDDCAARGIRFVHLWSFMPPRQKQDGSLLEERWGYVYPGLTPWARKASGPAAADGLPQWDLQAFDDGPDSELTRYWPRLRDLCRQARSRGLVVGITVFTGWAKHNADWAFHPLNRANGGHLTDVRDAVRIASPGAEVLDESWSDAWPDAQKTQWVWERFSGELVTQLNELGNVFFVFLDEHSYDEGNMGDHFARFFKKRGAVWADWGKRRETVDFVYSDTFSQEDKNAHAVAGFEKQPARPYLLLEGEPYAGPGVRTSIWTFAMGGGHYTFHADAGLGTPQTGIMGYDPHVPGGDKGMPQRDGLGHASRFFNRHVRELDAMRPHNELVGGGAYCLANPGEEYAVYSPRTGETTFPVDLTGAAARLCECRFYDTRVGAFLASATRPGGSRESYTKPDADDWALLITVRRK